jgi:hypothetical protein
MVHLATEEGVDSRRLREILERLDAALLNETVLLIRGGAAVLALGLEQRMTVDIDVLPESRYVAEDLRRACEGAGLAFNPGDKEEVEGDYLETVPEETLILPRPSEALPYNTVFRGQRLTVRTPPGADLVVGKLKRLDPEDLADIAFLVQRFGLVRFDIEEAFGRLPDRFRSDPVVVDNLRYVIEDYL